MSSRVKSAGMPLSNAIASASGICMIGGALLPGRCPYRCHHMSSKARAA